MEELLSIKELLNMSAKMWTRMNSPVCKHIIQANLRWSIDSKEHSYDFNDNFSSVLLKNTNNIAQTLEWTEDWRGQDILKLLVFKTESQICLEYQRDIMTFA